MENKHYKILIQGNEFDASEYQDKIFQAVEFGTGNLLINAAAGASKTTTIVNAIRFIPEKKKVLFIAFNKDIVAKIKSEITHSNAEVYTFHSLGYHILLENKVIEKKDNTDEIINEYKYKQYIKTNIEQLSGCYNTLGKDRQTYITNIVKLCDYARTYLAMSLLKIKEVADIYDVIPVADEIEVCRKVLLWGKSNLSSIDYTDLVWLPNVLNLVTKKYQYNWVFVDEAQDTSIMQQQLVAKCFKRGTRFAAVMDEFQQINIWCGSTMDAIDNFKKYPNTKTYSLPISYRCPKKIVELARQYSNNIIAKDDAIEGEIRYDVSANDAIDGDMVLCRTTAPLIEQFLKYLRINKKCYIRGFEEIKKNYLDLIEKNKSRLIDRNCVTCDGLFPKLFIYLFKEIDKVMQNFNLDLEDAMAHFQILELYDSIEALKVLSEGLSSTDELIDKINIIFNGNTNGVELSTVHKAKGLEADNVYILYPSLMPNKFAKKDWEIKTEDNLIYVAYTRAKKTLNFIKENDFAYRTNGCFDPNKTLKEINRLKLLLNYNKENGVTEKNFDINSGTTVVKKLGGDNKPQEVKSVKIAKQNKNKLDFRNLLDE